MFSRRTRMQRRVMLSFDDLPAWTEGVRLALHHVICWAMGHEPERDQCGMPEHDFCLWCGRSMPGAALKIN